MLSHYVRFFSVAGRIHNDVTVPLTVRIDSGNSNIREVHF